MRAVEEAGRPAALLVFDVTITGGRSLRAYDPAGKQRWVTLLPEKSGAGADTAATLAPGELLVVAPFHRIATGAGLVALDAKTGALRWAADVAQLRVSHSKSFNDVSLERQGDTVVMRGYEAGGCYLQLFDLATGRRLYAKIDQRW